MRTRLLLGSFSFLVCVFILHLWMLLVSFSLVSSNKVQKSGQAAIKKSRWEEAEKEK